MNKFAAIALLAFACTLVQSSPVPFEEEETDDTISQLAAVSDETEIERLEGKATLFTDYCITTRGNIMNTINTASRDAASQALFTLFNSVAEIGTEALTTQQKATDVLGNQIKNPNAPLMPSTGSESDEMIVEGQERIMADPGARKSFVQAIISTLSATGSAIAQIAAKKLANLNTDLSVASNLALGACDKIAELESQILEEFERTKQEIVAKDASLSAVTPNQIPCFTSTKVLRASALCQFAKTAQGPLVALWNLRQARQI